MHDSQKQSIILKVYVEYPQLGPEVTICFLEDVQVIYGPYTSICLWIQGLHIRLINLPFYGTVPPRSWAGGIGGDRMDLASEGSTCLWQLYKLAQSMLLVWLPSALPWSTSDFREVLSFDSGAIHRTTCKWPTISSPELAVCAEGPAGVGAGAQVCH